VERAKIVLMSANGMSDYEISKTLALNPYTVRTWRTRFISNRIDGLKDLPRPGKPIIYDKNETRKAIFDVLEQPPPKGQATFDGKSIASKLGISDDIVWRILEKRGNSPSEGENLVCKYGTSIRLKRLRTSMGFT
jgi:transposase